MVPKNHVEPEGQPSPTEDSGQIVARGEGVIRKHQHANIAGDDPRIEQAETRTKQAEARTEEANTRTEQAERRTEQAENSEHAISASELSYRRLFESAKDGILILDVDTGRINDVNPFLVALLGFSHDEMVGKTVGELSPFKDIESNKIMLERLQKDEYVRYEDLPLETRDGRHIAVEFVSNVYQAGDRNVIQCNIRDISDRKRVELVSIQLAAIVQSSDDAIIGLGLDNIITSWNASAERIFGYPAGEMVGRSMMRLVPTDRQDEEKQMLGKIKRGQNVQHFETVRHAKDGRLIDVSVTASPIKNATGKVGGVSKTVRDITERKRAEKALRISEERFRTVVDQSLVGIYIIQDGKFVYLNPKMEEIFGVSSEVLRAQSVCDFVAPEDRELVRANIDKRVQGLVPSIHYDLRILHGNGEVHCVVVHGGRIEYGVKPAIMGTMLDITGLKQAEAALRQSAEYFRFLNDLAEATRALADPEQIMKVMARMLGEHLRASRCAYADVEKDGERFTILHDYTDGCATTVGNYQLSLFGARAVATLNSGQTLIIRNVETELLPVEGADMFNAIGIKAIITCPLVKDGGLRAMMAVHQTSPRDWQPGEIAIVQEVVERCWASIERRTAEEKIRQLNAELEQRVVERTAQLQAANEELHAFSYSVSHDLRAPLRHVMGFADLLQKDAGPSLSEKSHRHLTTISRAAKRMGNLIDDLLAFARIGRSEMQKTEVNLDQLVQETLGDFQAETKGRTIAWKLHPLPHVRADRALLRLVLVNLISNAVKFTGTRTQAKIEIGCAPPDEKQKVEIRKTEIGVPSLLSALPISALPQEETVIFIRDNGAGFDPRYTGKLFGVFQRLHSEAEFHGTGIGLANVQRIIRRHGGRAWAEGVVDGGATFYFSIPKQNGGVNEH